MRNTQIKRNRKKFFHRTQNQFGFTLAELLAVIAIIGIVAAFGFVNVVHHQRRLKLTEEDNIAREIFTSSQNHMQAAVSDGSWVKQYAAISADGNADIYYGDPMDLPTDVKKGDRYNDKNHDWRRFVVTGSNVDSLMQNTALGTLLPQGSIDESVRNPGNGSIVIEYDALQGEMFGVFYSDSCSVFNTTDVMRNFSTISARSDESNRLQYTPVSGGSSKYAIGYYGVSVVNEGTEPENKKDDKPVRELKPVAINLVNESKLLLHVTNPNDTFTSTYTITLYDSNGHSLVLDTNEAGTSARLFKPSETKNGTSTYILDSITDQKCHFSQLISGTDFSLNTKLHAAITVSRKGTQSVSADSNAADSLFGDGSDGVNISIDNVRHLENLSYTISGLSKETNIVSATVEKDLSWSGFWSDLKKEPGEHEKVYDNTGNALDKKYYGIKNSTLAQFTGKSSSGSDASTGESGSNTENNKVALTGFDIAPVEGSAGILADLSDDSSSSGSRKVIVSNFELKDTKVTDAGNAGALIGVTGNCSITVSNIAISGNTAVSGTENVGAILGSQNDKAVDLKMTNCSVDGAEITGGSKTAGGLVGAAFGKTLNIGGCTVKDTTVTSNDSVSAAGGLIGSVATADTVKINKCSVEVSDKNALSVSGATAGGFIGSINSAKTVTIKECFVDGGKEGIVTASVASAGGFIGSTSSTTGSGNLSVADCYSSVLVKAQSNAGGFIGEAKGKLSIDKSYSGGRTDKDQNYSGSDLNVTSTAREAGGFIGSVFSGANVSVQNSYSTSSAGSSDCAGGFIGNSSGNLTISNSYSTGLVKAKESQPGLFIGSGNLSTGSTGNYCLDGVKGNTGLPIIGDKEDSAVTAIIKKSGFNNESAPFSVTKQAAAKPYTFTNNKYPFKTVEQLAGSTEAEGKHVGDWPAAVSTNDLKTLDRDVAIVYYEEVQHPDGTKEFYYHGYKMNFYNHYYTEQTYEQLLKDNAVVEIGTRDSLDSRYGDQAYLINDSKVNNGYGREYVVESGYVLMFDKNRQINNEKGYSGDNPQPLYVKQSGGNPINIFQNNNFVRFNDNVYPSQSDPDILENLAQKLGYCDVNLYYINPDIYQMWNGGIFENAFWLQFNSGDSEQNAQFYLNLFSSDGISTNSSGLDSNENYTIYIRSAYQLKKLFDNNPNSQGYKFLHNNGQTVKIYQTMDISYGQRASEDNIQFTECGKSINKYSFNSIKNMTGKYFGAVVDSDGKPISRVHSLRYMEEPFAWLMISPEIAYLNFENITAKYLFENNNGYLHDLTIDNSELPISNRQMVNAVADLNDSWENCRIENVRIKNVHTSGSGVVRDNKKKIKNIEILNSIIDGSGIADSNSSNISNCRITGTTIAGNGAVTTNNGPIDNVEIQSSVIVGSGIADTSSSNISNCKIAHSEIKADGIVKTANNIIKCTLNDVNISGNGIASSKEYTNISECSIINANISGYGLIKDNNGGTISDCNIINAHIQKSGFSGTNKGTINNCHLYSDPDQWKDCIYFNAADTTNGYLLLTVGLQSGSSSDVFRNDNGEAGFVENNSGTINGCSFTGSVYGDSTKGTAGFFVTNSGTIENSYSNVVVNCGETANAIGAGFGITNSNKVNYCHSAGKIFGGNNTIQAGFVYEVTNDWNGYVNNCYSAIFNMNHNSGDDPFACKSWSQNNVSNAFINNNSRSDGFLNVDGLVKSKFAEVNSLSFDDFKSDTAGAHLYGSQAQTSNPYYVWMDDTSAGNADPYPMPSYNGQTLASYGDWYDPDHIKYSDATSLSAFIDNKEITEGMNVPLFVGNQSQLTFRVLPIDAKQEVVWQSSDPNAVSVDNNEILTAIKVTSNPVSITGTAGKISLTFWVNVANYDLPTGVKIYNAKENGEEVSSFTLNAGESKNLFAFVSPIGTANQSVNWSSSDPQIAAVDANGVVAAKMTGTAIISASSTADVSKTASCEVIVNKRNDYIADLELKGDYGNNKQYTIDITNNKSRGNYDLTLVLKTQNATILRYNNVDYPISGEQTITLNFPNQWLESGRTSNIWVSVSGNDSSVCLKDVIIQGIHPHIN